jgi:AAA15 family ATPase/GTPase
MLIEFSVSNFRSFREKQTFSMVAAPRLKKGDNVFKPVVKGEKLPDLLKVAAIYGPNASGKSNLIKALSLVSEVAKRQPSAQSVPFPVSPFRFDPQLADQPTRIELHFIYAEQRYEFQLAITQERIVHERLVAFPKGKEALLYERQHLTTGDQYTLGEKLEGGRDLHELWKKSTGSQVLFINQAVANSNADLNQLREPLKWLNLGFLIVDNKNMEWLQQNCKAIVKIDENFTKKLIDFLQTFDIPITDIHIDEIKSGLHNYSQKNNEQKSPLLEVIPTQIKTVLTHQSLLSKSEFDFEEESEGTQNLIGFWLPWSVHNRSNFGLIVDELDSSLHPEIVIALITKHLKAESPAQLIFTTHDTHLMDAKLLRRDQFWITERDTNGATQLRSIHDFEGRESEDIEKRYYEGRYRGLPFVRRG